VTSIGKLIPYSVNFTSKFQGMHIKFLSWSGMKNNERKMVFRF